MRFTRRAQRVYVHMWGVKPFGALTSTQRGATMWVFVWTLGRCFNPKLLDIYTNIRPTQRKYDVPETNTHCKDNECVLLYDDLSQAICWFENLETTRNFPPQKASVIINASRRYVCGIQRIIITYHQHPHTSQTPEKCWLISKHPAERARWFEFRLKNFCVWEVRLENIYICCPRRIWSAKRLYVFFRMSIQRAVDRNWLTIICHKIKARYICLFEDRASRVKSF